jgi:hypothetical protein
MILWAVLAAAVAFGVVAIWRRKSWRSRRNNSDGGSGHTDWDSGGGDGGGD